MKKLFKFITKIIILLSVSVIYSSAFNRLAYVPTFNTGAMPIEYYINLGTLANHTKKNEFITAINAAFNKIQSVETSNITFLYKGLTTTLPNEDSKSVIYLDSNSDYVLGSGVTLNYVQSIDGKYTTSADIAIFPSQSRIDNPELQMYPLILHEALHLIGLDHSSTGNDSAVFVNTVNLDLSADDIAGISALYPSSNNPISNVLGSISGIVRLIDGTPIKARIVAIDESKEQSRIVTVNSNDNGVFNLIGLPQGTYKILVEYSEHSVFKNDFYSSNFQIIGNSHFNINFLVEKTTTAPWLDLGPYNASIYWGKYYSSISHPSGKYVYFRSDGYIRSYNTVTKNHTYIYSVDGFNDMAISNSKKELYAVKQGRASYSNNSKLTIIDIDETSSTFNTVISEITDLPTQATDMIVVDDIAYVISNAGLSMSVIDLNSREIINTIVTGKFNQDITYDKKSKKAYIGTYYGTDNPPSKVLEIDVDGESNTYLEVTRTVYSGNNGAWTQARLSNDKLAVGTRNGVEIVEMATGNVLASICGNDHVFDILLSDNEEFIYCLSDDDKHNLYLTAYETTTFNQVMKKFISNEGWLGLNFNNDKTKFIVGGGYVRSRYTYLIDVDIDGDGIADKNDKFPLNPNESVDTDHDGIGNNADKDDDGDGISDVLEIANGLNPLKASDAQADFDNDGFTNAIEISVGTNIRSASSKPIWTPIMMGDIITFVPAKP